MKKEDGKIVLETFNTLTLKAERKQNQWYCVKNADMHVLFCVFFSKGSIVL